MRESPPPQEQQAEVEAPAIQYAVNLWPNVWVGICDHTRVDPCEYFKSVSGGKRLHHLIVMEDRDTVAPYSPAMSKHESAKGVLPLSIRLPHDHRKPGLLWELAADCIATSLKHNWSVFICAYTDRSMVASLLMYFYQTRCNLSYAEALERTKSPFPWGEPHPNLLRELQKVGQ